MAPKQPDPSSFELVLALKKSVGRAWLVTLLSALTSMFAILAVFFQSTRPIPVVYRSDTIQDASQIMFAGGKEVPTREIDAKRFLVKASGLLHGWSSATVVRDLTASTLLMTVRWRKLFIDEVQRVVDVPPEVSPTGKESQLGYYAGLKVRNILDWQWDSVTCERNETKREWGCYGRVLVETQPLIGDPLPNPPRKNLIVRATFTEVPVTKTTIDGLLIDFWDVRDADAPKPATP